MTGFIQGRLLLAIPTVFAVSIAVFLMLYLIPGDPASIYLGDNLATPERLEQIRHEMGLDRPIYVQYLDFIGRALQGDLGRSLQNGRPVALELAERLPRTAELAAAAFVVSIVFGVSLGIVSALRHNTWVDSFAMLIALAGVSMPIFWLGLMAIYLFAVDLRWLPPSTRGEQPETLRTGLFTIDYLLSGDVAGFVEAAKHLFLPAVVLATVPLAVIARQTRSAMLEVLSQDFVRTAWSKGLRERAVVTRHVLKNAMLPVITVVGLQVGALLSGAVLTETVFSWPGLGTFVLEAIVQRDYPVVQSIVLVFALIFVLVNLLVDVSYGWLDPRIRYG